MNLGHIDYLNCYPFYYHAFEKAPLPGIQIVSRIPSVLNQMMAQGRLDMGPVSAATYADLSDDLFLLPDFCLSSIGYVGSVILISKVPIEDLHAKKVGLTRASHTSVVLLKVLLEKFYDLKPNYVPSDPRPALKDMDAALVIGNDAMVKFPGPAAYSYDLGDLWLRKTGFPVVFAVFVVRKDVVEKYENEIRAVISSYRMSLKCLEVEKDHLIQKAKKRYSDIMYDIEGYYDLLKFEFTKDLKHALLFYIRSGEEWGLLKKVTQMEYLNFS